MKLSLSAIAFYTVISISSTQGQILPQGVSLTYPKSIQDIKTFEKTELALELTQNVKLKVNNFIANRAVDEGMKMNPYVSWSLKYVAIFTHESGEIFTRDGFYYLPFSRSVAQNKWVEAKAMGDFRIRFAFPKAGNWTVQIQEWQENKNTMTYPSFNFNVQSSNHPGYVSVHPNRKNLQRGDEIIVPVGANLFSPVVNNNLYYSGDPKEKLNVSAWDQYQKDLKEFARLGGKYVRFIMEPTASEIEFEEVGNYTKRLNYAWEMDQMLETAEENDILIQWNCMIQSPFKIFDREFQSWDFKQNENESRAGYGYSAKFNLSKPSEIFYHPEAWKYFKERYRYILARWGYSPQITFFELMSEPFWMDKDDRTNITPYDDEKDNSPTRKAVAHFHWEMAKYIKEELKHTQHLLAALSHVPGKDFPLYPHPNFVDKDNSWHSPNIDIVSMNMYKATPAHFHMSESNVLANHIKNMNEGLNKPVFLSETQTGENFGGCSNHVNLPIDIMSTAFVGIAGFNIWETFFHGPNEYDDRENWSRLVQSDQFFKSHAVKVLGESAGKWQVHSLVADEKLGGFKKKKSLLGVHYYSSENGNSAAGVLINRTYNIYTKRTSEDSECAKLKNNVVGSKEAFGSLENVGERNNELTIEGLAKKRKYTLVFHDFISGAPISTTQLKSNRKGAVKMEFPVLTVKENEPLRPAIWFSIEKQ